MLFLRELGFSYGRGTEDLFRSLTHQFAPRSLTVLTGVSGRGKSTLLYLAGLLLRPTRGVVEIAGLPVSDLSDEQRSRLRATQIGFVFQDAMLDPSRRVIDAVVEPALYAGSTKALATARARELLQEFGVEARADGRPGEISGGQAQRVAMARALINRPRLVLADEPTGNLDLDNTLMVLAALSGAAQHATVVVATHDPVVIERADEVLAL